MTNFNKFFLQAKTFDPIELKPADYFTEELIESFYPKPGSYRGMKSPWSSFNQAMIFKRSELVVWSGFSGSGKSQLLGQVAIEGMSQGERFVICSLEMPSRETLKRMARQLTAEKCPTEARLREATAWLKDKLWLFNVVGKMKTERIFEVFKYAVKRYDIRNFILDSLTKCNIREDDYEGQKEFVDALCDFNHRYEATTHLVVHQRKPSGNSERPDKFGARGAAAITDEASSVICVWRPSEPDEEDTDTRFNTKKKATKKDQNGIPVDSVLYIDKNRETGIEGKFNLFFDQDTLQFQESKTTAPIDYLTRSKATRSVSNDTF
jgi:twinkle protein